MMMKRFTNFHAATIDTEIDGAFGVIERAELVIEHGKIVWLGREDQLPKMYRACPAEDLAGHWITPGLIDCHSHVVYAGHRAHEFEMRLQGKTYAEIAQSGGGIVSTVAAVQQASRQQLFEMSLSRVRKMMAHGVTTLEIKSGYGLELEHELKMLQVIDDVEQAVPIDIHPTFLALHALPKSCQDYQHYTDAVLRRFLPAIQDQGIATAVDVFCEHIAFSRQQCQQVLQQAQRQGLQVKIHAEQLSDQSGAAMAASLGALSADHLEYLTEAGVAAMAQNEMVAVLLPGAFYFLNETQLPPIALLRQYQVPIAIATDCNPGSAPTISLPLMLSMACRFFGITPLEALQGVTKHAAQALAIADTHGVLAVGKNADFAVWDIQSPVDLAYHFGDNPCLKTFRQGVCCYAKSS